VVLDASGRHRRPAGGPLSTDEFLSAPTTSTFPAAAGPGWAPDLAEPWSQWNVPPPVMHPDHPSAPVPRVRASQAPTGPIPVGNPGQLATPPAAQPLLQQRRPGGWPNPGGARPRANPPGRSNRLRQAYNPGWGDGPGQYPRVYPPGGPFPGDGASQAHWPSPAYGAGQGYGPAPGYRSGQGYNPGPGQPPAHGYNPGQPGFAPAPGYDRYQPGAGYSQRQSYPDDRDNRRLYAVPGGASVPGPAPWQAGAAHGGDLWSNRQARSAGDEAAAIRQAAEHEAAVIRQAAEQEAAELRAAVMAMSTQLGHVATYLNDYLGKHALREERPQAQGIATREWELVPETAARPNVGMATPPRAARTRGLSAPPDVKPGGRQAAAMRKMTIVFAALLSVAVLGGLTELGLHGFGFFVFRSAGTGATDNNGLQENQGPGQPDAPGTQHAKPAKHAAHHSAPKPTPQQSLSA